MTPDQEKRIQRLENAMFGDQDNMGMDQKVSEIYEIFVSAKLAGKVLIGLIITLGALALAFTQIGHFISKYLPGH
jgi:hypothetical protein